METGGGITTDLKECQVVSVEKAVNYNQQKLFYYQKTNPTKLLQTLLFLVITSLLYFEVFRARSASALSQQSIHICARFAAIIELGVAA